MTPSELFFERPHVHFMRPDAAILMSEIPEGVSDSCRIEQIFCLRVRTKFAQQRHVDPAVDIDVRNVDALRMEIPRHHLSQAAHRELCRSESGRVRPGPDPRRRASYT